MCQPIFRQVEIELVGRVGGRTFDERKLEFEVGEGLNVNIPRSNDHVKIYSRIEGPCLFYFLRYRRGIEFALEKMKKKEVAQVRYSQLQPLCDTFTLKKLKTFLLDSRCP